MVLPIFPISITYCLMQYVILAGGFATRLWPLTEKRAKPLLLIAGKTILAHIFDQIPESSSVLLLTNRRFAEDFKEELQKIGRENHTHIFCEDAEGDGQKLGAVKALSMALRHYAVQEGVCVVAGDNLLPKLSLKDLDCSSDQARLAVREVENFHEARRFGVVEMKGERVSSFIEKPENPVSKIVSTGFMSFGEKLIDLVHTCAEQNPDSLGSIFTQFLCHDKEVLARVVAGEWFDVGSFETYLDAHRALQEPNLIQARDVEASGNVFSGKVYLGEGVRVENCRLHDTVVYPGTVLKDCHIACSVVDTDVFLEKVDLSQKLVRSGTVVKGE